MAVSVGAENLGAKLIGALRKKRVGLIANRTAVTRSFEYTVNHLRAMGVSKLVLFSPEHGFHLVEQAGQPVSSYFDSSLGLTVHSLYRGEHASLGGSLDENMRSFDTADQGKSIPDELAEQLDTLVLDIQDVGTRVYTHVATMLAAMRTCARRGIEFVVLDRPNPINGVDVEGPVLEYPKYRSYVGAYSIAMRHGMTLGELAQMFNSEALGGAVQLKVVKMRGWRRTMWFDQTGRPWLLPSPNMPTLATATVYPGQVMFEGTNVSEGRGTTKPFEIIGAPWIDGHRFAREINAQEPEGARVAEIRFRPTFSKWAGQVCSGIEIHVLNRSRFRPFRFTVRLLDWIIRNHEEKFEFHVDYFDRVAGNSYVRAKLLEGDTEDLLERVASEEALFQERRKQYLLYR